MKMPLENQVVSLELAKKLKELGINQESLWWWYNDFSDSSPCCQSSVTFDSHWFQDKSPMVWRCTKCGNIIKKEDISTVDNFVIRKKGIYSAYTCAELCEMLPFYRLMVVRSGDKKECTITDEDTSVQGYGKNLTNAMAKMLIYLIENKLVDIKDLK